jgi:beta-glucosidase
VSGTGEDFIWGTAASATQTQGAGADSDWFAWERAGRAPRSGAGNGFGTRFAEDFARYREFGLTHHRMSIDWSRIEPQAGRFDSAAVEAYAQMLDAAQAAGISPWLCLHHFTVPGWFADEGGFRDARARGYFWPRFVAFCAETFGGSVAGWQPINEPFAYAAAAYLLGEYPPGRTDIDQFFTVYREMILAGRDAWRELRGGGVPVATIHNLSPLFPADESVPAARNRATVDQLMWQAWMRADRDGVIDLPGRAAEEVPDLRESADLIGFSYYSAHAVRRDLSFAPYPPSEPAGPLGYAAWPEGLSIVLHRLHDELPGRPLLVAELGLGTAASEPAGPDAGAPDSSPDHDDGRRRDYLADCLTRIAEARRDGVDIRGVFFWTGVDNYEWTSGYRVRFGLFDRDRQARPSAEMVREAVGRGIDAH